MSSEKKKVSVLDDTTNKVVVHVEGREYPGLVLQGDQLQGLIMRSDALYGIATSVEQHIKDTDIDPVIHQGIKSLIRETMLLRGSLNSYIDHYNKVCSSQ